MLSGKIEEATRVAEADLTSVATHSALMQGAAINAAVVTTGNTSEPIGSLQNHPESGQSLRMLLYEHGKVYLGVTNGDTIVLGDEVSPEASGQLGKGDSGAGDVICGRWEAGSTSANDVIPFTFLFLRDHG